MSTVLVSMAGDRLAIRAPYIQKDRCKAIAGAKWDGERRCWVYPARPLAAAAIAQTFGEALWDDAATALRASAETITSTHAALARAADEALDPIPLVKTTPWAHQVRAYHFARHLPGCLFDMGMGTGKTKTAIDLIVNQGWTRVLILCPKSVVEVWPYQISLHAAVPMEVAALGSGALKKRAKALENACALADVRQSKLIVVVNYESVWSAEFAKALTHVSWDAVICDESHRIKAPGGKTALFCSRIGDLVPHRLALTGTPMPHSPLDIYAQYRFLDKGVFGTSFALFRARYAQMGGYGNHQVKGYQNLDELYARLSRISYRVKSEDVQDLPEAIDTKIPTPLDAKARAIYRELDHAFTVECQHGTVTASNALTRLLRLQQLTGGSLQLDRDIETGAKGAVQVVDTTKRDALVDILTDADEPIVVFCRFHQDLDMVHEAARMAERASLELSGRRNELASWQQCEAPVLAVQIQSGSMGIDLTRARITVFYSLGFSLGDYEQARKRVHRPGQTRTVQYYHLISPKTVDEDVYAALQARQEVVSFVLDRRGIAAS